MSALTGPEILRQIKDKRIQFDGIDERYVGPASVDVHLHPKLSVYAAGLKKHLELYRCPGAIRSGAPEAGLAEGLSSFQLDLLGKHIRSGLRTDMKNPTWDLVIPKDGLVLSPDVLYLGRTKEFIGSDFYLPIVNGRSSTGRLGVKVHFTAGQGDPGFKGTFTLEIESKHPIRIFPGLRIGQVMFLTLEGQRQLYEGRYNGQVEPTASRIHMSDKEVKAMNE